MIIGTLELCCSACKLKNKFSKSKSKPQSRKFCVGAKIQLK
ncbi:zinc-finger domain-containing protein [Candidatus Woesearchaeota archaeon]|nr:zinc-finger domain-containing protein [Candidatus Woesearchaeota archaeon]